MKVREIQELKNKDIQELERLLKENQEKLRALKFDLREGKVKNVGEVREVKKLIARILTFTKQKNGTQN